MFDRLGGYIEKLGSGIRRMIDAMKEHGLEPPLFELKGDLLKVTLRGPGERFMELAEKAARSRYIQGLNERQLKAMEYLQTRQRLTRKGYCELTGISSRTAHRDLTDLVERGILRSVGKGRGAHYILIENPGER